jgi:hypothetical protein
MPDFLPLNAQVFWVRDAELARLLALLGKIGERQGLQSRS